jgi:hypothetical protein
LNEATGVDTVDTAEKDKRLAQMNITGMLPAALRTVEDKKPSIEASEFGSVENVAAKAASVVAEFRGSLPEFKTAVRASVKAPLQAVWQAVSTASNELQDQKQIDTFVATMDQATRSLSEEVPFTRSLNLLVEVAQDKHSGQLPCPEGMDTQSGISLLKVTRLANQWGTNRYHSRKWPPPLNDLQLQAMLVAPARSEVDGFVDGVKIWLEIKDTIVEVRDGLYY